MKYKARQRGYEVLGEFRPDQVLPHTGAEKDKHGFGTQDGTLHMVKMSSLRYQTFSKSLVCNCCGIEGTVMLLEMPGNGGHTIVPHFNLYAKREGELVQMTKDHIKPRSRGGKDHIGNMQTLCCRCNELKGNKALKLKRLRKIQDGVQTVYTVQRQSGHIMEGFATSDKGVAELVRQYMVNTLDFYEDSQLDIRVSIRLLKVTVCILGEDELFTFHIKRLGRI